MEFGCGRLGREIGARHLVRRLRIPYLAIKVCDNTKLRTDDDFNDLNNLCILHSTKVGDAFPISIGRRNIRLQGKQKVDG
jgi:hypothetical protein